MTGAEALDLLMSRYGQRSDSNVRAISLSEMKLAQATKLERDPAARPWFLLSDDTTTYSTTGSVEYVSCPNLIGLPDEIGGVFVYDSSVTEPDKWVELVRKDYNYLRVMSGANAKAIPEAYDILNEKLYLRPIPDATYLLRVIGYIADTLPTDGAVENSWLRLSPDLLIAATGMEVAGKHLRDDALKALFMEEYMLARRRLMTENDQRIVGSRSLVMGGND
jgi:hypothetical protein